MASGDTLARFHAGSSMLASADATFDEVNDQLVLDFDAATDESATYQDIMPQRYGGGGVTVRLRVTMSSATSGNVVVDVQFEDQTGAVVTSDGFASVQSDTEAVPGVANTEFEIVITFTDGAQMDSVGAGDLYRVRITRDANNASDTAAGDMQLHALEIRES